MPPPYTMRACIHQPFINGDSIDSASMETLIAKGLLNFKMYGSPEKTEGTLKKFMLMEFGLPNWNDIRFIDEVLHDFKPVYCFNETCPQQTFNCPAYRPK